MWLCGARTHRGGYCTRTVAVAGERCHYHGYLSTGPRTLTGKLRNGSTLRLYRITNGGVGKRKTDKAMRLREDRARRRALWAKREPIRRLKAWRRHNKHRAKSGLPLLTDAELDQLE